MPELSGNYLAVYYNERSEQFYYSHRRLGTRINGGIRGLEEFYRNNGLQFAILPSFGSAEYFNLLSNIDEDEMERSRAKPADDFSIVISYKPETNSYEVLNAVNAREGNNTTSLNYSKISSIHMSIEDAYSYASELKASYVWIENSYPWNIWPRKNSIPYRNLVAKICASEIGDLSSFNSMFAEFVNALKNTNQIKDEEAIQRFSRYASVKRAAKRLHTSNEQLNAELNRYIKAITGVEYVFAFYKNGLNLSRLVHPSYAKRIYNNTDKTKGYAYYATPYYNSVVEHCDKCKEGFIRNSLVIMDNARIRGSYCSTCLDELGWYRCGSGCSGHHHEDDGCPVYLQNPHETIYNYSADVRNFIHKMQQTPEDKKINGEMLRYGVELEVLPKIDVPRKVAAYNCGKSLLNHALLKSDSSLGPDGFEIVTIPATLEYHRQKLWSSFFNTVLTGGKTASQSVRSWDTLVCGIHVHVTRAALTEMQLSKLLVFYHEPQNSKFLSRIAGREVGPNAVYCKAAKKKLGVNVRQECEDHHGAIAVSRKNRGKTAEVRIFRGNVTKHGIIRAIEFVDATVKWCGQNSTDDVLKYANFLDWFNQPVIKSQYPELRKHLIDLGYIKSRVNNEKFKHLEVVNKDMKTA